MSVLGLAFQFIHERYEKETINDKIKFADIVLIFRTAEYIPVCNGFGKIFQDWLVGNLMIFSL